MTTSIIISSTPEETRMGVLEDKVLREYLVERDTENHLVGDIFLGRVCNVVPGLQAAFVDIGLEQNAFLFIGNDKKVTEGKAVLVQISKDARGSKGPTATREVTIPGRYVVLVPDNDYIGISRKIGGATKTRKTFGYDQQGETQKCGRSCENGGRFCFRRSYFAGFAKTVGCVATDCQAHGCF
jgi:Ribonuclease G/E